MRNFLLIIAVCMALCGNAAINKHLSFSQMLLSVEQISLEEGFKTLVSYHELPQGGAMNMPSIPCKQLFFNVPLDATDFRLTCTASSDFELSLPAPILYNSGALTGEISVINPPGHTMPYYPETIAEISNVGIMGGCNKIVVVSVYPISVGFGDKTVVLHGQINVTLDWKTGVADTELVPATPKSIRAQAETKRLLSTYTEGYLDFGGGEVISPFSTDQADYEYIIVAPKRLCESLERLAAIRRTKGFSSKVFPIEQVLSLTQVSNGDEISGINDDAGKLRAFISYAYQNFGTRYVLLAGKYPEMPIRYGLTSSHNNYETPSDLYFSDITGSWKKSLDGKYIGDTLSMDYFSEIHVGRLEFSDCSDVENYINKLNIYEFNPGVGDYTYLNKALLTRQDRIWPINTYKSASIREFTNLFKNEALIDMSESKRYPEQLTTGADVIKIWNEQPTGIQNFIGHGNPGGIGVGINSSGNQYGIVAEDANESYHVAEQLNGIDCLCNRNYPGWALSVACHTMPFDDIDDRGNPYTNKYTFGASYTLGKEYGGIAFFGHTRDGYASTDNNTDWMNPLFRHLGLEYADKSNTCGVYAGEVMSHIRAFSAIPHHERLALNLLGDPLANLWISAPSVIPVSEKTDCASGDCVYKLECLGDVDLMVASAPLIDATYARRDLLGEDKYQELKLDDNVIYTIVGKNSLPYILPLRIRNFSFFPHTSRYLFVNDLHIGENVDQSEINEYVTVETGSNIIIESANDVHIYQGFIIKDNASVYINASNFVDLQHVELGKNSTLHIKADIVNYQKGDIIKADETSVVIIEQRVNPAQTKGYATEESMAQNYTPMVVEGRTWWYGPIHQYVTKDNKDKLETAVAIGKEVMLNGVKYNKVYIKRFYDNYIYFDDPDRDEIFEEYNEDTGLIGYMRENTATGEVFFISCDNNLLHPYYFRKSGIISQSNEEKLIYNWAENSYQAGPINITVYRKDKYTIENSGIEYTALLHTYDKAEYDIEYEIVEGIGITDKYDVPFYYTITNPYMLYTNGDNTGFGKLRYVTDAQNNIIFNAAGGFRLWEYNTEGVADILSDTETGNEGWYDLFGHKIDRPIARGLYIHRFNGKAVKETVY